MAEPPPQPVHPGPRARAAGGVGLRDLEQADGARPRSARRHRARLPGPADRRGPEVTGEDIDRAIEIIRDRVDALGVAEPEISRVGEDQIEVGLPNVHDAERAIDQIGTTAQLYFYDFEPNVIPPNPDVQDPASRPYNRLIDAVEAASKEEPVSDERCAQQSCTTSGHTYYLFDADTLEPLGDPADKRGDLFLPFGRREPANSR